MEEDLDLVVQLGDYIYEGAPNPALPRVQRSGAFPACPPEIHRATWPT